MKALEPVRAITLTEIKEARVRIDKFIVRTPLLRLDLGQGYPDIRLKLENLQPTNSYKLRGAVNAVAMLSEADRQRGVWTLSAGNAGQGVAYAARQAGVPCKVVVIETAPALKIERTRPFDDHNFISGHATMGLEILEDAAEAAAIIAGIGGGGLITGVGSAVKALNPRIKRSRWPRAWSLSPRWACSAA
jgi:threonine dehydratase